MNTIETLIWIAAVLWTLPFIYGIRTYVRRGIGITQPTVNTGMLLVFCIIAAPILQISTYHLFWMIPLSHILGLLSLQFPFSLLSILGRPFGFLCCFGLNQNEVTRNTEFIQRYKDLRSQGVTNEEAQKAVLNEFRGKDSQH